MYVMVHVMVHVMLHGDGQGRWRWRLRPHSGGRHSPRRLKDPAPAWCAVTFQEPISAISTDVAALPNQIQYAVLHADFGRGLLV